MLLLLLYLLHRCTQVSHSALLMLSSMPVLYYRSVKQNNLELLWHNC